MKAESESIKTYPFYRISRYKDEIGQVAAVSHTNKTVTYLERWNGGNARECRSAIVSEWYHFFPTLDEAKKNLRERLTAEIKNAKDRIKSAEKALEKLN